MRRLRKQPRHVPVNNLTKRCFRKKTRAERKGCELPIIQDSGFWQVRIIKKPHALFFSIRLFYIFLYKQIICSGLPEVLPELLRVLPLLFLCRFRHLLLPVGLRLFLLQLWLLKHQYHSFLHKHR